MTKTALWITWALLMIPVNFLLGLVVVLVFAETFCLELADAVQRKIARLA